MRAARLGGPRLRLRRRLQRRQFAADLKIPAAFVVQVAGMAEAVACGRRVASAAADRRQLQRGLHVVGIGPQQLVQEGLGLIKAALEIRRRRRLENLVAIRVPQPSPPPPILKRQRHLAAGIHAARKAG